MGYKGTKKTALQMVMEQFRHVPAVSLLRYILYL